MNHLSQNDCGGNGSNGNNPSFGYLAPPLFPPVDYILGGVGSTRSSPPSPLRKKLKGGKGNKQILPTDHHHPFDHDEPQKINNLQAFLEQATDLKFTYHTRPLNSTSKVVQQGRHSVLVISGQIGDTYTQFTISGHLDGGFLNAEINAQVDQEWLLHNHKLPQKFQIIRHLEIQVPIGQEKSFGMAILGGFQKYEINRQPYNAVDIDKDATNCNAFLRDLLIRAWSQIDHHSDVHIGDIELQFLSMNIPGGHPGMPDGSSKFFTNGLKPRAIRVFTFASKTLARVVSVMAK